MYDEIIFNESAFKHGVTELDIRWAFRTNLYDAILQDDKFLLIGFDIRGNTIEVMYNINCLVA
jgi:hypothetical protein